MFLLLRVENTWVSVLLEGRESQIHGESELKLTGSNKKRAFN